MTAPSRVQPGSDLWWTDAVVYQLYPRSFADSNGDGRGDLEGIRQHLDHLQALGVNAIWLTPCFPSPQRDHGYDVADYFDIEPTYGSLDDFDRLMAEASQR
ncbi:MAG: alpha-amylase family glycosyl hydrolase, partial [Ilumatobacteraceae bacterium]